MGGFFYSKISDKKSNERKLIKTTILKWFNPLLVKSDEYDFDQD